MPALLIRLIGPARTALLAEFLRFGTVGFAGFIVDNATVYGLRGAIGLYWAGTLAYCTAATTTWALNRTWTYAHRPNAAPGRQWGLFLLANTLGFTLNRGTYFLMIANLPLVAANPVLGTFAGTLAGMLVNFHLSRTVVFR
jgi:putative flippase GtrA